MGLNGDAVRDVIAERARQIADEGFTPEHDDAHTVGQLALAASAYAYFGALDEQARSTVDDDRSSVHHLIKHLFPAFAAENGGWDKKWWKPVDRRRDLVKAASLLLAEIDRIDRVPATEADGQ